MDSTQQPQGQLTAFCQACGSKILFDASAIGRKARCLNCKHVFVLPDTRQPDAVTSPVKQAPREPAREAASKTRGDECRLQEPTDEVKFDPLEALASSEKSTIGEAAEHEIPVEQVQHEDIEVISNPSVDPQATVTALGVMLGLLYLALIAIGIILLHANLGVLLTIWILLPLTIVHGRKTVVRIVFLLAGKTVMPRESAG
jgi:hypothetical protein